MPGARNSPFKQWLSRPPRPHGAIRFDRRVSFLELFYDLVYVAVIGQASHQLAEHITVRGAVEFAIVFGLIWFAWINGSLYVELHGGEDGRTRNIVFVQMCILALLAVFTAGAADRHGTAFSVVCSAFLLLWVFWHCRGSTHQGCRPGSDGQRPARVSSDMAIRAGAEWNPNARRAINRTLVLSDSTRPLLTPCWSVASMSAR